MPTAGGDYSKDKRLVASILAGSEEAWHAFIERYSGLINSVLRRYLFDEEEIRDVWVQTLDKLYRSRLQGYEGRSALSTWLVFVARSTVFDHLRRTHGRRGEPASVEELPDREREVFRLFYREGRSYDDVRHHLRRQDQLAEGESLAEILGRIEDALGDRTLRRIAWDLHATSVGTVAGRLLEYLDVAAREIREQEDRLNPEFQLFEDQTRETLARVQQLIEQLPEQERRVIQLRYDEGWPAHRIADELEMSGQREVYTAAERALRRLRRWLGIAGILVFFLAGTLGIAGQDVVSMLW